MKTLKPFLLILFSLAIYSCSPLTVVSDYDKTVDFTQYKTYRYYGWDKGSDSVLNRFDKERIEKAFAYEFGKHNLTLVPSDGDLVVTLYVVTKEKKELSGTTVHPLPFCGYYGYGPGWNWGLDMRFDTHYYEVNYSVGTLMCSVYDVKEEKLIWEGAASKTIDEDPDARARNIPKIVHYLMKKFPV
ncbi:DUF4136 domain-containing protein [Marinilabiliaceae bacterium JC017]|nr:DUF4136 domain-containing protein [Marinilabiliaceae bacterium JC017]